MEGTRCKVSETSNNSMNTLFDHHTQYNSAMNSSVIQGEKDAIESLLFMKAQTMLGSASRNSSSVAESDLKMNDDQQCQNYDAAIAPQHVNSSADSFQLTTKIMPSDYELNECKTLRAKSALQSWYQRLNELYEFKQEHGHCDVPQKYPQNRCLGIWVVSLHDNPILKHFYFKR
jgi:Helicase associated domain